jgi:serpin B
MEKLQRWIASALKQMVEADNVLGFQLLQQLHQAAPAQNISLSPFSIALALGMAYNGAEGEPKKALGQLLGDQGLRIEAVNAANRALLNVPGELGPNAQLAIANSIWVKLGLRLATFYVLDMREVYDAEVGALDFRKPAAADLINRWVASATKDMITELVTPDLLRDAVLVLINALYFKGVWATQFDPHETAQRPFTCLNGACQDHPLMSRSGQFSYLETETFQAVALPYGAGDEPRIEMIVLLPKPHVELDALVGDLSAEQWTAWMQGFHQAQGTLMLPRFKTTFGVDLKSPLVKLVGQALADTDFLKMGAGPLRIDAIIHKTVVEVNEEGTEAAAATAVVMTRSLAPVERFRMTVDRPFFYAIRDRETGLIWFIGMILNPQEKGRV